MNGPGWDAASEIFADALELPESERAAFVDERCRGMPDVRAAVSRLLTAHDAAAPGFMRELDGQSVRSAIEAATAPLERVGPYRLTREIGRGGMGQVFLAGRDDGQFTQRVAVKLLKRGMDSDAILTRFLRERQILAGLDHPNIARLIDGGIATDGRPYFVMEHVDGQPITQYCDVRRLTVDERLDLFSTVCSAVEHAHRNLIVHRDLKPSNILVTADGEPKLLDFGIARMISGVGDSATVTLGGPMLTPEYAAPEQFGSASAKTSADVYSLGVLLYELLSGRPAFTREAAARRMHSVAPPQTMSRALVAGFASDSPRADISPDVTSIAAARSTDPIHLRRRLRGDLETIASTALHPDPERRYVSAEALREDVGRHRRYMPVRARPDTAMYRTSRFVRRHRAGVTAGAVIAALAIAFTITAAMQSHRITRQATELQLERDRARREAAAARSVADFLVGVFEVSDPQQAPSGDSIRATELLDRGAAQIDEELRGQPDLQARMLSVMGRAYDNLMRSDRAEPLVERALALQRTISGNDSKAVVAALQQLADVRSSRGNWDGARAALREALAIQERLGAGPLTNDPVTWSLLVDLAGVTHGTGDHRQATRLTSDALVMFDRIPADRFNDSRASLERMARLLRFSGADADRAERVYARLADVQSAATGPSSMAMAVLYSDWAEARQHRGDLHAADSLIQLAFEIQSAIDSMGIPTAHTLLRMADLAFARAEYAPADSLVRRAERIFRLRLGEDHRMVAVARMRLGEALIRYGQFDEAIQLFESAIATFERLTGESTVLLFPAQWRLGAALQATGRHADAARTFDASLRGFSASFPEDYLLTANVRRDYAATLLSLGRFPEAEAMALPAIAVLARRWGAHDLRADLARITLGDAIARQGRRAEGRAVVDSVVQRLVQTRGPQDSLVVRARQVLMRLR